MIWIYNVELKSHHCHPDYELHDAFSFACFMQSIGFHMFIIDADENVYDLDIFSS